jgi:hypothetical protein
MTEEEIKTLDRRYEAVGWSLWLIWIGAISIIPGLPGGTGTLGTALLLLGLNVARYRHHLPVSDFSLILGVLALIDGGAHLLRSLFAFHIHLEFFPVLMVIVGTIMTVHAVDRLREFSSDPDIEKPKRGTGEIDELAEDEIDSALIPVLSDRGSAAHVTPRGTCQGKPV